MQVCGVAVSGVYNGIWQCFHHTDLQKNAQLANSVSRCRSGGGCGGVAHPPTGSAPTNRVPAAHSLRHTSSHRQRERCDCPTPATLAQHSGWCERKPAGWGVGRLAHVRCLCWCFFFFSGHSCWTEGNKIKEGKEGRGESAGWGRCGARTTRARSPPRSRQGLTLVHVRAQVEQLQDTLMS